MKKTFMPLLLALFLLLSASFAACTTGKDGLTTELTDPPGENMSTVEPTVVTTQGITEAPEQALPTEPTEPDTVGTAPVVTEPPVTEPAGTEPTENEPAESEPAENEPAENEPIVEDMTPIA